MVNQSLKTLRNVSKASATPNTTLPSSGGTDLDIVDLLKDICGSVNELKTEMGNSGQVGKINLEEIENKLKYPQKFAELSEKSSKMEVECGFFKTQCQTLEEKFLEEKRRNSHLEELIRDRENEIRQLNVFLQEAKTFSKRVEQENGFLQLQLTESKSKLEEERERKDDLRSEFDTNLRKVASLEDKLRSYEDKESKIVESLNEKAKKNCSGSDGEMELEVQGVHSARSTVSSKSAEGGFEEKYKEEKESRSRLKQKTKLLLRQYRGKRSQLERKERQLATQRSGLLKLQTLHQSVEANHCIVIHHLGQQIQQIANLVSTLWPGDDLSCLAGGAEPGENKLSEWIIRIDSLSGWTISKLVKVSMSRRRGSKESVEKKDGVEPIKESKVALRAAALKCELGIVDEGRTVERMISGLEEEEEGGEDTDRQVGTWM